MHKELYKTTQCEMLLLFSVLHYVKQYVPEWFAVVLNKYIL